MHDQPRLHPSRRAGLASAPNLLQDKRRGGGGGGRRIEKSERRAPHADR